MKKFETQELDANLYYLLQTILDLSYFKFDKEITKELAKLRQIVENKLYSEPIPNGYDINDTKIKLVYYLEK